MNNPLKDLFSTDIPKMGFNLSFENTEKKKEFVEIIEKGFENGEMVEVSGIKKLESYIETGDYKTRTSFAETATSIKIRPNKKKASLNVNTDFGPYEFAFETYTTKKGVVFENDKNSIIHMRFVFEEGSENINFTFAYNVRCAKTIKELLIALNAMKYFLAEYYLTENPDMDKQIDIMKDAEAYFKIVYELESALETTFSPQSLPEDPEEFFEEQKNVYKLYFSLVKQQLLKQSVNNFTATMKEVSLTNKELIAGNELAFMTISEVENNIYGADLNYYQKYCIINGTISEFENIKDNDYKLKLIGTDTKPLFQIFKAYKTMEEAESDASIDFKKPNVDKIKTLSELLKDINADNN